MRTVKRQTLPINTNKLTSLKELCQAYSFEKNYWLKELCCARFQRLLGNYRLIRNELVKNRYQSKYGLQGRHWKLALQDAVETWDKYWQALFVKIRSKIFKRRLIETERRYAYGLVKSYEQFAELMQGKTPQTDLDLSLVSCKRIAGYIRNLVKRLKGQPPKVKKIRTIKFDANCYESFEHEGRQYLKIMSLNRGKRITLPLKGHTKIQGTLTLVLSEDEVCIHLSQELKAVIKPIKNIEAVDFGYTEVITDTQGIRYGQKFGSLLTKTSDSLNQKMQKRHRLHVLKQKHPKKAKNILKYNLGKQKFIQKKQATSATLTCEINRAINQLIESKQPSLLITEDLSHLFTFNKTKAVNRRLSSWLKGEITNRISFKALAEGFCHEQVNSAYSSQICPLCDFVDRKNRKGDKFMCCHCQYEDVSDHVAALNLARRYGDPEISLYTPYSKVKTIYLDRFHRRLEVGQPMTVPGSTLETVADVSPPQAAYDNYHSRERFISLKTGWSIKERNKNKHI